MDNREDIDLSILKPYEAKLSEIVGIDYINGPLYMRDFLLAKERAVALYHKAIYQYERAKDKSAQMRAIAFLDRAKDILEEKELRVNEEGMKQCAMRDPDYLLARDVEAYLRALVEYLSEKVQTFQNAHDDAKKIYDQSKILGGSISSAPSRGDTQ
jgi:hypothetical protein